MSDGKKFFKIDPSQLAPEERLNELDRKYDVIRGRIQMYDAVLQEFNDLHKKIDKVFDSHDDILVQFVNFANTLQKEVNGIRSSHDSLMNKIRDLQAEKSSQNDVIQSNKEFSMRITDALRQDIKDLGFKHDKAVSMLATSQELNDHKIKLDVRNDAIGNQFSALDKRLEALQQTLGFLNIELDKSKLADTANKKAVKEMQVQNEFLHQSIDKKLSYNKDEMMKMLLSNRQAAIELMERTREEVLGSPIALAKIREEIMNKLEGASLDSSNASLKTANCEKQVSLLEKKIESILALLKKKELTK